MPIENEMNIAPVFGTALNDTLTGTGRSEVLSGAGGDDFIAALSGDDEVFGGTGDDTLYGQGGNDVIYGNGKPAYVDMSNLTITSATTAKVTFMNEGAGYRNALGVYEIGTDGAISNVQVLFANASKQGSGGDLIAGESAVDFAVSDGAQLGFFIVSNGYGKGVENREALDATTGHFEMRNGDGEPASINDAAMELWHIDVQGDAYHVKSQYGFDLFHSTGSSANDYRPNPDSFDHVVGRASTVTGELLIGFEDLYGGGDRDYDDTVIRVEFGQENVVAMLPESNSSGSPKSDDDIIYGGDGDDVLHGISGDDFLSGGNGNDVLNGNSGNDVLNGNDGVDELNGQSGDDALSGGRGNDVLNGNSGNDTLNGDAGQDRLVGGSGDDVLNGGSDADTLDGSSGADILNGGSGDDLLNGNSGDDLLNGDSGADVLKGHSGNDTLSGGSGRDRLEGGGGADLLNGGEHNDKLYGGSGNDELFGGAGRDYLTGGSGNDVIEGGSGNDRMRGGSGADQFVFDAFDASVGDDTIYDFDVFDSLLFSGFGFEDSDDVLAVTNQVGEHLAIALGADELTIRDYSYQSFVDTEFMFA